MNILYNYKTVDKSNPTYKSDKSFGSQNEIKFLNYLNTTLYPDDKFRMFKNEHSTMDFMNSNIASIRKLSFIMQLSDPDDYEGGNVILLTEGGQKYVVPRQRGTVIIFDSRTMHCVNKVKKGLRKSLVAWAVGPRWK